MKEDFTLELLGKDHSYMAPLDLSFIAGINAKIEALIWREIINLIFNFCFKCRLFQPGFSIIILLPTYAYKYKIVI